PAKIVAAIEDDACTVAFASPVVWNKVLRWCRQSGRTLPSLTRVLTAGAPIQADMHRRFREILAPGVELFTPYGATEGMTVSVVGSAEILDGAADRAARGH